MPIDDAYMPLTTSSSAVCVPQTNLAEYKVLEAAHASAAPPVVVATSKENGTTKDRLDFGIRSPPLSTVKSPRCERGSGVTLRFCPALAPAGLRASAPPLAPNWLR